MGFATSKQASQVVSAAMALGIQGLYEESSTQKLPLGSFIRLADGRGFAYAQAGGTALVAGNVLQSEAPSANATDETVAVSAAVGDTHIHVTFGGAVTANQYAGGFLYVNDDTGEGNLYSIKGHAAGTTSVQVELVEAVRLAITAGAGTVSCIKHPLKAVIKMTAATCTGCPVGVAIMAVTADYYCWIQVKGPCPVLSANSTFVIGNQVATGTTAGAIDLIADACVLPIIGTVLQVQAGTENVLINLAIPGY